MSVNRVVAKMAEDGSLTIDSKTIIRWVMILLFGSTVLGGGMAGIGGVAKNAITGGNDELTSAVKEMQETLKGIAVAQDAHVEMPMHEGTEDVLRYVELGVEADMRDLADSYEEQQFHIESIDTQISTISSDLTEQKKTVDRTERNIDLLVDALPDSR